MAKLQNNEDFTIISFPDGHKHLKLNNSFTFYSIQISIKSFDDLFLLAQFRKLHPETKVLVINYLLCARCDRRFSDKETLDLKIVTDFINNLKFDYVYITKPHSDVSMALIDNSISRSYTKELVVKCIKQNNITSYSFISPDAGASKWIEKELGSTNIIQCSKDRDAATGEIKGVKIPELPNDTCIIVDDLCDGGATFINIAKQLKAMGVQKVYLVVTHGIFSKGFEVFDGLVDHIYCTNSFADFKNPILTQILL